MEPSFIGRRGVGCDCCKCSQQQRTVKEKTVVVFGGNGPVAEYVRSRDVTVEWKCGRENVAVRSYNRHPLSKGREPDIEASETHGKSISPATGKQ